LLICLIATNVTSLRAKAVTSDRRSGN